MKTRVLYDDGETTVEILKAFHCHVLEYTGGAMRLERLQLNVLYNLCFQLLEDFEIEKGKREIYAWDKAPLLMPGVELLLTSGYDVFEPAIKRITSEETLSDPSVYEDIYNDIKEIYADKDYGGKIIVSIFNKPLFNVRGICIYCEESRIQILFWGYEDPEDDGDIEIS